MATPSDFSLEGSWDVPRPQPRLTITREPLILALKQAILERSFQELITVGHQGESNLLQEWRKILVILERDEPVAIR